MTKHNPAQQGHVKKTASVEMHYSGPLPPSSELEKYDKLHPGAAEAIIGNFLAESDHRRDMERRDLIMEANVLDRTLKAHNKGQNLAITTVLLVLGVGTLFMFKGHPVEGAGIIGTVIVGLVTCFMYGSKRTK